MVRVYMRLVLSPSTRLVDHDGTRTAIARYTRRTAAAETAVAASAAAATTAAAMMMMVVVVAAVQPS